MHDRETALPQKELNAPFPQPSGEQTLPFDATHNILKLPMFSDNSSTEMQLSSCEKENKTKAKNRWASGRAKSKAKLPRSNL